MAGDGAALARDYERRLFTRVLGAHYFGAFILGVYTYLAFLIFPAAQSAGRIFGSSLAVGIPTLAIASFSGLLVARPRIRFALRWLEEERPPSSDEQVALSALPSRLATIASAHWLVVVALLMAHLHFVVRYRPGAGSLLRAGVAAEILVIVPWALSYFLVERSLRPIFARAFTSDVAALPKTMSISSRLIVAWAGTSLLPISAILLALVARDPITRQRSMPVVFAVCALGSFAGLVVMFVSGRTILDPLQKVRRALRSVEQGDLDVTLDVTDPAELGDLEVGINRMTLGLRERERITALFGRHVGSEVAARALEGEGRLGGDRREATAMFVDIIASTQLAATHSPEDVVSVLNAFFDAVVLSVSEEGGLVNKFAGDGALCIFGAPVDLPDHAERALRAARTLRQRLRPLQAVDAAIGVSSGLVVAGNVGALDRYEYTVIGDPVNEASRLTEQAKTTMAKVLASEPTVLGANDEAKYWSQAGTMTLRGRTEPTVAYSPAAV